MTVKRYWIFGIYEYEARGGMMDFICSHETIAAYEEELDKLPPLYLTQIFDTQSNKIELRNEIEGRSIVELTGIFDELKARFPGEFD